MGFFDLLSREKREVRARSKNARQAVNKYAQSVDRMKALESLEQDGSDEALYALLRRFGMMYDKTIDDEQEKEWVYDALCGKGQAALPAIKRYLLSAESVSWPLRVLDKIAENLDQELATVEEVLAKHEPGYERDPTKKIQLLTHLGALKHPRIPALLAPYLKDPGPLSERHERGRPFCGGGSVAAAEGWRGGPGAVARALHVGRRGEPAFAHEDRGGVLRAGMDRRRVPSRGGKEAPRRVHAGP
jgi:hypothetical protein